jgi:hypothetical protein
MGIGGNVAGPVGICANHIKPFGCNDLRFLTRIGARIAYQFGVNSEMNNAAHAAPLKSNPPAVLLDGAEAQSMRHRLHELANVFTGVMIAGGLLNQYAAEGSLRRYATDICESCERGCTLVRELRSQLLSACGEQEPARHAAGADSAPEEPRIF